ncbi:hypothetical protein C8R43DRAFT_977014, partial [Mycena crocata]
VRGRMYASDTIDSASGALNSLSPTSILRRRVLSTRRAASRGRRKYGQTSGHNNIRSLCTLTLFILPPCHRPILLFSTRSPPPPPPPPSPSAPLPPPPSPRPPRGLTMATTVDSPGDPARGRRSPDPAKQRHQPFRLPRRTPQWPYQHGQF